MTVPVFPLMTEQTFTLVSFLTAEQKPTCIVVILNCVVVSQKALSEDFIRTILIGNVTGLS